MLGMKHPGSHEHCRKKHCHRLHHRMLSRLRGEDLVEETDDFLASSVRHPPPLHPQPRHSTRDKYDFLASSIDHQPPRLPSYSRREQQSFVFSLKRKSFFSRKSTGSRTDVIELSSTSTSVSLKVTKQKMEAMTSSEALEMQRARTYSSTTSSRSARLIKILLCFLVLFVLSNLPLLFMDILNQLRSRPGVECLLKRSRAIAWRASCVLMSVNASINCPLYYTFSSRYKQAFIAIFRTG